ncbi:MAG: ketol-acid reductoisomerase [candidate division Zixibacteria bacterium]|nr:ketol-acid reductoisomerase [candidate division Zixibacteria bacterium]
MNPPLKVYHDDDISPAPLEDAGVAVIGYGSQGRAQALNLRDSGVAVTVGLRPGSPSRARAEEDGFTLLEPGAAVEETPFVAVLVPDEVQGEVVAQEVTPHVKRGAVVVFAHGGPVHFGEVALPEGVDVALVAPMGPGRLLREYYVAGHGLNAKAAVARDATGGAWPRALAYARALGCGRAGVIATTFAEEAKLDLFSEQAVLCGGLPALAEAAFETLVAAGYPPVLAYIECVREIKYVADLTYEHGLDGMRRRISSTALYGGATRGPKVVGAEAKKTLKEILGAVEDGSFVAEMRAKFGGREEFLAAARNDRLEAAREEFERIIRRVPRE